MFDQQTIAINESTAAPPTFVSWQPWPLLLWQPGGDRLHGRGGPRRRAARGGAVLGDFVIKDGGIKWYILLGILHEQW
jgi:hypothetical protein